MSNVNGVGDIILAVLASGGFFTLVQFLLTRWDAKRGVEKKVDDLTDSFEQYKATLARTHILRFSDDLHNDLYHSQDYFKQTINDIDTYDRYCEKHPEFANGLTKMASEYIREEYKKQYLEPKNDN